MPRRPKPPKPRRRMASQAQMARLMAVLGLKFPSPIPFLAYRQMMRQHRNPDSNVETELKAWWHLETRDQDQEAIASLEAFSQALVLAKRVRRAATGGSGVIH